MGQAAFCAKTETMATTMTARGRQLIVSCVDVIASVKFTPISKYTMLLEARDTTGKEWMQVECSRYNERTALNMVHIAILDVHEHAPDTCAHLQITIDGSPIKHTIARLDCTPVAESYAVKMAVNGFVNMMMHMVPPIE